MFVYLFIFSFIFMFDCATKIPLPVHLKSIPKLYFSCYSLLWMQTHHAQLQSQLHLDSVGLVSESFCASYEMWSCPKTETTPKHILFPDNGPGLLCYTHTAGIHHSAESRKLLQLTCCLLKYTVRGNSREKWMFAS